MRRVAAADLLALLALAVATCLAGEQTEVVVVRSFDESGDAFQTRVRAVDHEGDVFVRVANPQHRWYRRLLANPQAELVRARRSIPVRAEPSEDPALRAAVEVRFREKYGAVDWWYGMLLRRNPVPVRLRAVAAP
jgi:hypothetical protein